MLTIEILPPDGQLMERRLERGRITIGRLALNDLAFPKDVMLSRQHLAIFEENGVAQVEDLGSKNGTLLNGQRVEGKATIGPGDRIEAGSLAIRVLAPDLPGRTVVFLPKTAAAEPEPSLRTDLRQVMGASGTALAGRIRVLLEAGRQLARHCSLEELFPTILSLATEAVGAGRGLLMTQEGDGQLTLRASLGGEFAISSSVRDRVLRTGESIQIVDTALEASLRDRESIVLNRTRSLMVVPLQTDEKVTGLLYVDSPGFVRPFTPDDLSLLTVLGNIAAIRIENSRLTELEKAERVLQYELRQAAEIQKGLLPAQAPAIPGFDVAGLTVPCRQVDGDYFDYVSIGGGRSAVLLGDVSGKGLSAALLLAGLQARVHVLAETCSGPAELLTRLNRGIAGAWPSNKFVTMFACALDPGQGSIEWACGGHNPPLLLRARGREEWVEGGGPPVGLLGQAVYHPARLELEPGDLLVAYSDGSVEAETAEGEPFGEARLVASVRRLATRPAAEIAEGVARDVLAFAGGVVSSDDLTLVVVRKL